MSTVLSWEVEGIVQVSPVSLLLVFVNNTTELDAIRLARHCTVLSKFRMQVPKNDGQSD